MQVHKFARNGSAALVMAAMALTAFAQATPSTPEAAIADAIAKILLIIAAGGLGYITLRLAHVGWVVGAKFISRLGGKS
jgi:hypothetical protein